MNLRVAAACLLCAAIIAQPILAAPPKKRAPAKTVMRPAPRASATDLLVGAIALNTVKPSDNLLQACRKANFKMMAAAFGNVERQLTIEKSEFETAQEFAARKDKLENAISSLGDVIVCQPLLDNEDAPFIYDAESEHFVGTFHMNQNVWRDVKQLGTYVSRTAMGARATVKSSLEMNYNLDLDENPALARSGCFGEERYQKKFTVHVRREDAPSLKAGGYLVIVGSLTSPFVKVEDTPGEPTLTDPYDVYVHDITLSMIPKKVAVVGPPIIAPTGAPLFQCDIGYGSEANAAR